MPFDITITLSDEDLKKFQESIDKGKRAISDNESAQSIEEKSAELIQRAGENDLPPIRSRQGAKTTDTTQYD